MKVLLWNTLQLLLLQYVSGSPVGEETFVEVPRLRGPTFVKEAQQILKVCVRLFAIKNDVFPRFSCTNTSTIKLVSFI